MNFWELLFYIICTPLGWIGMLVLGFFVTMVRK